ncbi:DNA ligase 1-like [Dorcoceras hygrometricum]|uniref:DNA ligase 1-like n=1 Tax=Dorcoceras hygrometricum TaxID=472368 RepID=A0A2Z7CK55_9LAMI|nr:DNA ligase 1-like [Dorcoceras hygrometricum]
MDAIRVHKKCECEKTSTPSTSRPQRAKNSLKLVKVLRDLAVEIHGHAARMEKLIEEIGQILEDMAVSDDDSWFTVGNTMPISLLEEEHVTAFHDAGRQQLENSLDIIIPALGHAKEMCIFCVCFAVVFSLIVAELMYEGLYGEGRSCGRKKKLRNMGVNSPVASEKKKRMKFCNVTTSLMNKTEFERLPEKDNSKGAQKVRGPTIPIIIEISDDSVGFPTMSVTAKIGLEETVTSNYVVPVVELSSDEEEVQHGDLRLCGRKTKLGTLGIYSPVRLESVKRMKLSSDPQTFKATEKTKICDKVDTLEGKTRTGPSAAIIIDISDDSSG